MKKSGQKSQHSKPGKTKNWPSQISVDQSGCAVGITATLSNTDTGYRLMYLDPVFLGVAMLSGLALILTLMNLRKINALHREMAQAKQDTHLLIHALRNETHAMGTGSIGVGQRLMEVEKRLNQTVERQVELEQKDPGAVTYSYAVRLVEMGATAEDLVQNCGLARGEAELIARVHKEMRAQMQAPEEEQRYSIQENLS